ncbi:MAG: hypothetical protein WED05_09365 [Candidatus Atabeyarchaeum deiterrae]
MAITLASVGSILFSLVKPLIMGRAKMVAQILYKKLKGKVEESALVNELVNAVEANDVESFITKYESSLPKDIIGKIRSLAGLRNLLEKAEKIINSKTYTPDAASVFLDIARILEDIVEGISFSEAGIKEISVEDTETGEKIDVTSEEYTVALLLKFAAAVRTQLAMTATPSARGWALGYDASISVTVGKPQLQLPMAAPSMEMVASRSKKAEFAEDKSVAGPRFGSDFLEFRGAHESLMPLYRNGISIRNEYLSAVSCLKAAFIRVKTTQGRRQMKIHKYMDQRHLEGLVYGFRGEAQYWQLNVSEELSQLVDTVKKYFEDDAKLVKQWLEYMGVSQNGFKEFLDCLTLYANMADGTAGALRLYKEAAGRCIDGKDKDIINSRINEIEKLASNKARVFVEDPKPII